MKCLIYITILLVTVSSCKSQTENKIQQTIGGACEGCAAVFEYEDKVLSAIDTLPGFNDTEPKIKISGTVYHKDGKTPAENVILYIYHTNREGIYKTRGDESGWAGRHGHIRGWVKTGKDGVYTFYTFRPGAYPNRDEPEHIHLTIKEPTRNEYYVDAYVFEDDPLLTSVKREHLGNRGGSGLVRPIPGNGMMLIERDLILGLNIPDYR